MMSAWQMLAFAGLNQATRSGLVKVLAWFAELPDEEIKEIAKGMSPDEAACFWRVVRAAREPGDALAPTAP